MTDRTVKVRLEAVTDQYQRKVDEAARSTKAFQKEVAGGAARSYDLQRRLQLVSTGAAKFASATKYASLAAGAGLLYASQQASALNETMSFTGVTFKGATEEMVAWSDTTLDKMGLAKESALEAANGFGGLFQTAGSTAEEAAELSKTMVQLAVDMSSARDVGLDESIDALKSGLIGESEPMRRFNVLLSDAAIKAFAYKEGIAAAGSELTEAQKVQARLGVITEQTADIQGDYARTSDSAANAQRRASEAAKEAAASLGESLAPIMARVADIGADVAGVFSSLSNEMQTTVVVLGALVLAASPAAKVLELTSKATAAYLGYTTSANIATGASVVQLSRLKTGLALASIEARVFATSLGLGGAGAVGAATLLNMELDKLLEKGEDWIEQQAGGGNWGKILSNAFREGIKGIPHVGPLASDFFWNEPPDPKEWDPHIATLEEIATGRINAGAAADVFAEKTKKAGKAAADFAGMTGKEFRDWRLETRGAINSVDDVLERFAGKTEVSADRILRAFDKQLSNMQDYEHNWRKLLRRDLPDGLTKQLQEMGMDGAGIVDALANANDREFEKIIRKWLRAEGVSKSTANAIIDDMNRQKGKSQDLRGEYDKHPPRVSTKFETPGLLSARTDAARLYNTLKDITSMGTIRAEFAGGFGGPGGGPMGAAAGTNYGRMFGVADMFGLGVTSTYRPGDDGHHGEPGPHGAVDVAGSSGAMLAAAKYLVANYGSRMREVIHTPLGFGIKNGAAVPLAFWGSTVNAMHYNHVHGADEGGWFRGPGMVAMGKGLEYFAAGLQPAEKVRDIVNPVPVASRPVRQDSAGAIASAVADALQGVKFSGRLVADRDGTMVAFVNGVISQRVRQAERLNG